jgi:hypothetical protein
MKPDQDRTPEREFFRCFYCGEVIKGEEVVMLDGNFAHELCKENQE